MTRRRTSTGVPPDFERLVSGLFRIRRLGYGAGFAFAAFAAAGLRSPDWAFAALLALAGVFAGTGVHRLHHRLMAALVIDHLIALGLWWMIGPETVIEVIPVVVVSISAFVLPFRMVVFTVVAGELAIAARIPLHVVGMDPALPMYWAGDDMSRADVVSSTVVLMALAVAAALLFRNVGRMLERSRAALEASALRYRSLVEASPDGILIHQSGALKYLNEAAADMFGYRDAKAAINTPYLDHVSAADRPAEKDRMHQVASGRTTELAQIRIRRTDGSETVAETVCIPTSLEGQPAVQVVIRDATARHALRDTEQLLDTAFENSVTGIAIFDIDGRYLRVNRALCDLVGRPPEDLLTMRWQDITHPDAIEDTEERMAAALGGPGEDSFSLTTRYLNADGSEVVVLATVTLIREESGVASRCITQIVDITDSTAAQELLRSSEMRYRQLFERIPVAMYRSSPEGEILAANPALKDLMGYSDEEDLLALAAYDVYVNPAARSRWIEEINRSGTVIAFEEQLRRKDGTVFWSQDSARTVRNTDGAALYYEGAITDVTAQKLAEQAQDRLTRIIEATPDIVVVLDPSGWITYANAAARSYFSIDQEQQPPYLHVSQALDRETMHLLIEEVIPTLQEGHAWTGELDLQAPDGSTMPVSAVGLTHNDSTGKVARFSAVLRDVSEQVETKRQLQDLVRTKDEFVASVSHELRTPLTAVVGLAQELRDHWHTFEETELQELIKLVADQGTEVSAIVQDLLVAARADIGSITINPGRFRISDEVESAIRTIPSGHIERLDLDVGSVEAWADAGRFRQIIRNLVSNALRYGGPSVRVHAHNGGGSAVIEVTDDGPGIAERDWTRIFDPYFRAHDDPAQPASVGLGLTVSRQLAELMNGQLEYAYSDGLSRFTLRLPIDAETPVRG